MSAPVEQQHHDFELLSRKLLQLVPSAGNAVLAVPELRCLRREAGREECELFSPCLLMVVQGSMRMQFDGEVLVLQRGQLLLNCVDLHAAFSTEGSPEEPFLALALNTDSARFVEMFHDMDMPPATASAGGDASDGESGGGHPASGLGCGIRVSEVAAEMASAFLRLVSLDGDEGRMRFVAPLILREIYYYLASGSYGAYLRAFYVSSAQSGQIARAIAYMREHCHERLRIEALAHLANMAESTFNRNFRKITTLSPLQYHKNLKLHEARRLMAQKDISAAAACAAVGYESQQQFTREYKRLFGYPPMKDARRSQ